MNNKFKKKICIISTQKNAYSETFIKAHIDLLPAKILHVYGGAFPQFIDDDKPIYAVLNFPSFVELSLKRKILRKPIDQIIKQAFKKFLKQNSVSAVLAEYGITGAAVMDICEELKIPLIVHFHGADAYKQNFLLKEGRRYPALFKKAAATIAVSRDMERQLLSLGAIREKLYYNPYGVDCERFSKAEPANSPPCFVAVGRFVDKKAPHLLILAFQRVLRKCPEARLAMAGDGILLEACRQLVVALKMDTAVEFLGIQTPEEVAGLFRKSRAFVQHSVRASYGDSEGTPNTVLEAGAAGLPVIGTRHAGICDVVIENETGLLVDERDIDGMADHMIRLANDPELAGCLGEAARKRIYSMFSLEKSINNLWDIISEVI